MAKTDPKTKEDPDEWLRMWASLSFVGVLIIIGVPLWWKTTEVYRVALPYERIDKLRELPVSVVARVTVLANDEPTASELGGLLQELFNRSGVVRLEIESKVLPEELRKSLTAASDDSETVALVAAAYDVDEPGRMYVVQRNRLYNSVWLSNERVALFKDASSAVTLAEALRRWVWGERALAGAAAARGGDAARRMRLPPRAHYDVTLSRVLPGPDAAPAPAHAHPPDDDAFEDYIGSFVDELSFLHNFTLKSQWLHMLQLDFQATKVDDHYAVSVERLSHLLTPLEKRMATHISAHTTVNLVLYAVPCHQAPLYVYDERNVRVGGPVAGFVSPRWGGVVLASPTPEECSRGEFAPDMRLVMGTFLPQLRQLLGFDKLSPIEDASVEPLRSVSPRRWELDAVTTIRTLEQIASAKLTLQSLAQLLGEISNIVIDDKVGASVLSSVEDTEAASALLSAGDSRDAYRRSQRAFLAAEAAFTDPSLLALLYFPDDQKYAVYIPLFLPVMIPVFFSLGNIVRWLRGKLISSNTDKEKTD